jgi:hypothetical protein
MVTTIKTTGKPCMITFKVKTNRPLQIGVIIKDAEKPMLDLIRRQKTVAGFRIFKCNIPDCPSKLKILIYNTQEGNQPEKSQLGFFVSDIKIEPLTQNLSLITADEMAFLNFARFISYRLPYLSEGIYKDDTNKFRIDLLKTIPHKTPCRIEKTTKVIQCSLTKFNNYTYPGAVALFMHEYGHGYGNWSQGNESEADVRAIEVMMYYGFSKTETGVVFLNVFQGSDSPLNRGRFSKIKQILNEFEGNSVATSFLAR